MSAFRRVVSKKSVEWSLSELKSSVTSTAYGRSPAKSITPKRPGVGGSQRRRAERRRPHTPQPNVSHHTSPITGSQTRKAAVGYWA